MKHHFSHTTVHHHKDGSHTIHHHHKEDPQKDVEHAVNDHDGMMDSMQENLGGGAAPAEPAAAAAPPEAPAAGM